MGLLDRGNGQAAPKSAATAQKGALQEQYKAAVRDMKRALKSDDDDAFEDAFTGAIELKAVIDSEG